MPRKRRRSVIPRNRSKPLARGSRATSPRKSSRRISARREEEDVLDALAALKLMRQENLTAEQAAAIENTTVKKMRKHVGAALRRRGKDYVATPSDRLIRRLKTADARGIRFIVVRSSKAASLVGRHWNAIDDALKGKPAALRWFRGKNIPYTKLKFLTNLKALYRLQDAGFLDNLKDIYWSGRKR
jgi:hypothetical protein